MNGDKDMQVPTENSYAMHEKVGGSKLLIYPNAGHGSIFQYADEFSKELLSFCSINSQNARVKKDIATFIHKKTG